jgi:hypothetical protein
MTLLRPEHLESELWVLLVMMKIMMVNIYSKFHVDIRTQFPPIRCFCSSMYLLKLSRVIVALLWDLKCIMYVDFKF